MKKIKMLIAGLLLVSSMSFGQDLSNYSELGFTKVLSNDNTTQYTNARNGDSIVYMSDILDQESFKTMVSMLMDNKDPLLTGKDSNVKVFESKNRVVYKTGALVVVYDFRLEEDGVYVFIYKAHSDTDLRPDNINSRKLFKL